MSKIFLFTDYRGQFYSSTRHKGAAVDLSRLKYFFKIAGFELYVQPFSAIDFRTQNYKNQWVLYQSSEDPGLFYRDYVEDVVLGLYMQGAKLIPDLFKFRAHHNKHFMEIFRDVYPSNGIKNIQALRYGTYEDYLCDSKRKAQNTYVLKASDTSKSAGVFLLKTVRDKLLIPKKISWTPSMTNVKYFFERIRTGRRPLKVSNHRNKFTIQPYIKGLTEDYRIVVYGDKFYVLYRGIRPGDFRASGSKRFNFDIEVPNGLLDYARKVFTSFDTPYIALDIGVKNNNFYLFEFQFLSFGQYTLEKSRFFYKFQSGFWNKVFEKPDLEREIASSVVSHISSH